MTLTGSITRPRRFLSPRHRTTFWVLGVLLSLIVAAVVGALTAVIVAAGQATYSSQATLTLDQPAVLSVTVNPGEVAKLVALREKYANLATTQTFAERVAAEGGLPVEVVQHDLYTAVPSNEFVFYLGARDTDAHRAQQVASAAASAMAQYVADEQRSAKVPPNARLDLKVVSPATPPAKVSPSTHRELGAAGLAALVAFVLAMGVQALRMNRFLATR